MCGAGCELLGPVGWRGHMQGRVLWRSGGMAQRAGARRLKSSEEQGLVGGKTCLHASLGIVKCGALDVELTSVRFAVWLERIASPSDACGA
jgi:hypothetical protein